MERDWGNRSWAVLGFEVLLALAIGAFLLAQGLSDADEGQSGRGVAAQAQYLADEIERLEQRADSRALSEDEQVRLRALKRAREELAGTTPD